MVELNSNLTKITDESLRAFAQSNSDSRESVLVELKVAPAQICHRPNGSGSVEKRLTEIVPESPEQKATTTRRFASVHQALSRIVGTQPTRIDIAKVFVVEVTPRELRDISRLPDIGQIRPNREHRV